VLNVQLVINVLPKILVQFNVMMVIMLLLDQPLVPNAPLDTNALLKLIHRFNVVQVTMLFRALYLAHNAQLATLVLQLPHLQQNVDQVIIP